ncbi:Gfo/Idh/MocA family protein [Abyssibius alkaniclasticus]|uniref:Gfo/Idh/MocA family protein n=1 Tax=Abyssibius alkaniclasticus TaxID=2881234 RepID=UPI0040592976
MTDFSRMGAAVIGTGFIGAVHIGALRRLGVRVEGVLGSSPERGAAGAAALSVGKAYATLEDLLADPKVDLVHVTSPNHAHYQQVKAILAAGKHVICEKPLAMTSGESAEMVELARASGKIAAVCYNIRFYPLNHHAHGMVKAGALGDIRLVTGHYHQDWLAKPGDWNWRLESDQGGALRSVGDIGTHWVDLVSFVTGQKVVAVFADLTTFIKERQKPVGPVATFSAASGETQTRRIETDDAAMIMLRFEGGAKGVMTTSQISIGRKNSLQWDMAGSAASAAWDSETPDHLFIGHRDAPNQILQRDPGMMNATGAAAAALPGGHVEGFADSFRALFQQVYADAATGARAATSTYASFEDGHHEMRFCDAVLRSAAEARWVEV